MPSPEQERLDAISEALATLLKRQDEMNSRLQRIELMAGLSPVAVEPARAEPKRVVEPPPLPPPLPSIAAPPPIPPKPELETRVGLNWINHVAVVTLIFGVAFFFKYAVDNDWIGPGARVALGVVAAMISLVCGDLLWKRGQKIFAQGLTGLGLALLYLSFFATFGYHLLPQGVAFALMVVTTAAAAVFALRYESQAIAILGLVGGYLTPVMLSTGEDHPWILFSYTFLLNLGALALARMRKWRPVEDLGLVATLLLYSGWAFNNLHDSTRTVATVFAVAFYAQFATSESRKVWWIAQFLAALSATVIWNPPARALPLALLFAAGGLAVSEVRRWKEGPPWTLVCYWLAYWAWAADRTPTRDPLVTFGLLSPAFAIFFLWIVWWAIARKRTLRETDLLVMAANGAAYFGASYFLLNADYHAYMGLFAAALGALHLVAARLLWKPGAAEERESWPSLLAVAVTLSFLTLAIPIQFTGFRITIGWALEGPVLAWLAGRFSTTRLSIGGWAVFALVLLRLYALDSWIFTNGKEYTAIANMRFLTFAVSAVSLWLAARFSSVRPAALAQYIAGHFVMLWILGMEVVGWAERSASPADLFNVETTAISILMALYSLMLVAIGVGTRTAINRMLGLGLMGLVVLKLYLSDVWLLGRLFRITAFLGLGALLLLVSYLYSRFKPMLEKLWTDDQVVDR